VTSLFYSTAVENVLGCWQLKEIGGFVSHVSLIFAPVALCHMPSPAYYLLLLPYLLIGVIVFKNELCACVCVNFCASGCSWQKVQMGMVKYFFIS